MDEAQLHELHVILRNGRRRERLVAIEILATTGDGGVRALADALRSDNTQIAFAAATALAKGGTSPGKAALDQALTSASEWVRLAAAIGLASVGDARAFSCLRAAIDHDDCDQHVSAIFGLGALANSDAVALLEGLATADQKPDVIREAAVLALGGLGSSWSAVLEGLRSSPRRRVRKAVARALGEDV